MVCTAMDEETWEIIVNENTKTYFRVPVEVEETNV